MRRDKKAYVGVDIGTSSLATVVVDYRGEVLVEEMAAWGAALYVLDRDNAQNAMNCKKRSVIVETLRHEIMLGKYAVNERFPSEQMLVRRFKVARATVSHALAELKHEERKTNAKPV